MQPLNLISHPILWAMYACDVGNLPLTKTFRDHI